MQQELESTRDRVSIPIGFSLSLRLSLYDHEPQSVCSFNPYRVFSIVATLCSRRIWHRDAPVSIPIGFSLSLRLGPGRYVERGQLEFQSLSGFLYRCDLGTAGGPGAPFGFQSLSGFLYRCDADAGTVEDTPKVKFQSLSGFLYRCDASIAHDPVRSSLFQSLSGFLYRCDRRNLGC